MINIRNVSHHFGTRQILKNINLTINEKKVAIIGGNGSGKSTFARLLNGLLIPNKGEVIIDGLNTQKDSKTIRKKVGFVFQNPDNQIVFPIVEEDLAFGMKNLGLSADIIKTRIDTVLSRHNLLDFKTHPTHLLSGGQKQLIAILGVLVMQPEYIVFDEPTTLLDLRNKKIISDLINKLEQNVIVISHDLDLLNNFERIIVFNDGQIICDDIPAIALKKYREIMR
ncbi:MULTISPECIES: energy-coupling factor ABC transporter ATP-binding protein [Pasteurellaceae]|uniref:ATP-binding cassette domain-containing protein n=1 Tax=Pasteurella atlantica TaxID=2827233 RepID=A0AAW8CP69_9PAST|nr:ATP-binding cassette domain-containing protein [Pasteurella atlantica]MBR0573287.1 ATP-binding cassette domain-containing protein [Pasteurella atlantica]MDP8039097.1 ATP-binding cassette domain-containing protein [Pasteurella atlantica]MDP8041304.1 ATP-binding cassette domain-containing protein [Pasteurella atlantica]MDP8043441.1 ATP-binding cassette domain-containing protein [Pasteurella atlantica]MDP8045527.1 ATP-binding cassette domain-containing protein [Pasteurella atlantica]